MEICDCSLLGIGACKDCNVRRGVRSASFIISDFDNFIEKEELGLS